MKGIKPVLAKHIGFGEMSKKFVMVNTEDDEQPKGKQYIPDGPYTPRFLFIGKFGKISAFWPKGPGLDSRPLRNLDLCLTFFAAKANSTYEVVK